MYPGFFCTTKRALHYINSVERGKWLPEAVEFLRNEGIPITGSARGVISENEQAKKTFRNKLLSPWRILSWDEE